MTHHWKKAAPFVLMAVLASCAPKVSQVAEVQGGPDFSGKTAPVGKASATRVGGTCNSYAAQFEPAGLKVLPIPLAEGGLWSPLILEQTEDDGKLEAYARFISKNNGANTPNLNVLVHCQQLSSTTAQLEVTTVGPLPSERLKSVSERFLVALP